jgi:hypothetical protein
MWPFRRRKKAGKHLLGAAVTRIPSSALTDVRASEAVPEVPVPAFVPPPLPPDLPVAVEAPVPVVVAGPRVELGFRDGTTAALAPGSDQARALSDIATVLTQRD